MNSNKIATSALMVACVLVIAGCGDDSTPTTDSGTTDSGTTDSGTTDSGTTDSGTTDSGTTDSGTADAAMDTGTPATDAFVRVAHLSPNMPAVRVCAQVKVAGTVVSTVGPLPPRGDGTDPGIPFRGVSGYLTFPVGVDYTVNVYDIAAIDALTPERCPEVADAVAPLLSIDVPAAALEVGKFYTVAATGFMRDDTGALPALCGAALDTVCPDALQARVQIFSDDGAPAAGKVSIRVIQGIPNMPNIDICQDAADGAGAPVGAPTLIVADVAPTSGSAHVDMDPIVDGFITIHAHNAAGDCLAAGLLATVPVPFPAPVGTAAVPGSTATFPADTVVTIFGTGRNMATPPDPDPLTNLFIPMIDQVAP